MSTDILVTFPGGKRVDARIEDFDIPTDQSVKSGGEASAPEPFQLFLASIATCTGIYALGFCQSRKIDTAGLGLRMHCAWDEEAKRYASIEFKLTLPPDFPDKYKNAIQRSMDLCMVKKHIQHPPDFAITLE
jgi:ribosomal protein S12 methylthiotransferase accessory factor